MGTVWCVFSISRIRSFVTHCMPGWLVMPRAPWFFVCTFICDPLASVCGAYHLTSLSFVCRISPPHARCISLAHHHQLFTPCLYPAFPRILRIHHVYCCPAHILPAPAPRISSPPPSPRIFPPPPLRAYPPRHRPAHIPPAISPPPPVDS